MRVLHVVKTSDGADWAAAQAAGLARLGIDIHLAAPRDRGRTIAKWQAAGAEIHIVPTDLPVHDPWLLPEALRRLRALVRGLQPDIIHSHFFGSTMMLRMALGTRHPAPRLFQVPGPLHMEHRLWREIELRSAGPADRWIASSRCIRNLYRAAGVPDHRLYLSYYGIPRGACATKRRGLLRRRFGIEPGAKIVGNANFIYPPKWYLGQRTGLKAHEDVIDSLGLVVRRRSDVVGVLIGGATPGGEWYERRLRERALAVGRGRILMTGYLPVEDIRQMWPDFDIAVHVPLSENCGGVGEPMLAGVPVIAGRVGGLPEAVIDDFTGTTVAVKNPAALAEAILRVLQSPREYAALAENGRSLMRGMTSIDRIAAEMHCIYTHVLRGGQPPEAYNPADALAAEMACAG